MNAISAARAQFNRAQWWLGSSLLIKIAIVLGTSLSLFFSESSTASKAIFVVAAVGQVGFFLLRWRADASRGLATSSDWSHFCRTALESNLPRQRLRASENEYAISKNLAIVQLTTHRLFLKALGAWSTLSLNQLSSQRAWLAEQHGGCG